MKKAVASKRRKTCDCLCHTVGNAIHIVPCCDRADVPKSEYEHEIGSQFTVLRIPSDKPKKPRTN